MANISIQRPLQTTTAAFVGELEAGPFLESGDNLYFPVMFENFSGPDIVVTEIDITDGQTTLSGAAGKFDNIRPGDIISSTTTGSFTANATIALNNIYTVSGQKYVIYPETYADLAALGAQSGDAITGTGIPVSTFVERIDVATRRIFLTNACTASAIQTDVELAPPVRVTAVRKSTATSNANQIDIDSDVATDGADASITFKNGARDAVFAVLRITPVDSATTATARHNVDVAYVPGASIVGSAAGFNGLDYTALTYVGIGTFTFNLDSFLSAARVPQPSS